MRTNAGVPELERRLVEAARIGAMVDLCTGEPYVDAVSHASAWAANRVVRAELVAGLLVGDGSSRGSPPRAVKLRGARVTGPLDLEAASLVCPLLLQDCYLEEVVNLRDAQATTLRLRGCCVPGINANQLRTRGNVEFCDGFTAHRGVNLIGAHVGGSLVLDGADLASDNGDSLRAARIIVDGRMSCRNGFTAHNGVNLISAQIKGDLDFSAASLTNRDGPALLAVRMKVNDAVFFREGFTSQGEVSIRNSYFASFVDFADARLSNPAGIALRANGVTVERGVSFDEGFTANGAITLAGAHVGRLNVGGGSFRNPDGFAIDLEGIRASSLLLLPSERPDGAIDLSAAQVTNFCDDPETWPTKLHLRDFTYEILENDTVSVRSRLHWLALHEGYVPGIYDQLASTYRRAGAVEESRIVSIAKQKRRRRKLNPIGKAWNWLLYLTVGYGYRTWWAGLWLLGLLTIGSIIFARAYPENMVPAAGVVPAFQPVAYTIDVLVPLVDLGQKKAWIPKGAVMIWSWVLTGWGWVLTTAVVAGLTNALKRD